MSRFNGIDHYLTADTFSQNIADIATVKALHDHQIWKVSDQRRQIIHINYLCCTSCFLVLVEALNLGGSPLLCHGIELAPGKARTYEH